MDINGESVIGAPPGIVWEALNDADILRRSIPGCEALEKLSDTDFRAKVLAKIGPVKARFEGEVALSDLEPPLSYVLSGRGSGGSAGRAKGAAHIRLEPIPEGTRLTYEVKADVSGKIAQLGARLLKGTATSLAAKFFANFEVAVTESGTLADEL